MNLNTNAYIGWPIMLCSHISATVEQIITKFSTVVTRGKKKEKLSISAHLYIGNYGNQIRHITNLMHMGEGPAYNFCYLLLYKKMIWADMLFCVMNIFSSR